jgi:hypothetical protein
VGTAQTGTGQGVLLRSTNVVSPTHASTYLPASYNFDMAVSVIPGNGIFFHGWTLISERDDVIPEGESRAPVRQRNPRLLWAEQLSIGSSNPNEVVFTSVDQCVDGMWGELQQYPLQWTGAETQIGDRYSACTFLRIDEVELFRRIARGTPRERLRCSGSGLEVPFEIGSPFPPFLDSTLPVEFQVAAERAYDQLEWRLGNNVVGRYGAADGTIDVVKFVVTITASDPIPTVVYQADFYCMRGIGVVVQEAGRNITDVTRLRRAMIDGRLFDESSFEYRDF